MVESETTQMTMYDAGEVDFLGAPYGTISLDAIDRLKSEDALNVTDQAGVYWYKFNTKDPVMQNENIRKALALAIDRKALVSNIVKVNNHLHLGLFQIQLKALATTKVTSKTLILQKRKIFSSWFKRVRFS